LHAVAYRAFDADAAATPEGLAPSRATPAMIDRTRPAPMAVKHSHAPRPHVEAAASCGRPAWMSEKEVEGVMAHLDGPAREEGCAAGSNAL
jgi:hypothetical protein